MDKPKVYLVNQTGIGVGLIISEATPAVVDPEELIDYSNPGRPTLSDKEHMKRIEADLQAKFKAYGI